MTTKQKAAIERLIFLLDMGSKEIEATCETEFFYDGSTADQHGYRTDCENAIDVAKRAFGLSA